MATAWERLATFEGGSVADLAAAQAADGSWHVFAATAVGVFRSVDRGRTWAPLGVGRRVAGAEVVAASPRYAEDGLVYVGAHDGVYSLSNPDASWRHLLSGGAIQCIALDAGDHNAQPDGSGLTVFAGTLEDGILVSRNGGQSWQGANAGLLDLLIYDLALSPSFGEDGIAFAAMSDGLYRTRNGAESWRQIDTDTDDDPFDAVAVSPTFSEDRLALAYCFSRGLFRSDNGGRTWEQITLRGPLDESDDDEGPQDGTVGDILGLTLLSQGRALAWTERGVAVSSDGGQTFTLDWQAQRAQGVQLVNACAMLPAAGVEPATILAGAGRDGVLRSEDGGDTWKPSSTGLTADLITNLSLSPAFATDQTILLLSLENRLRRSQDGGSTWHIVQSDATADNVWDFGDDDDLDDDDPDDDDGDFDDLDVWGADDLDEDDLAPVFEGDLAALAWVSGAAGGTLLAGGTEDGLFLSHDVGESWQPAWNSPPVPPRIQSLATAVTVIAAAKRGANAHLLADLGAPLLVTQTLAKMAERADPQSGLVAPSQPHALVASRDGGQTWATVRAPTPHASVTGIALAPDTGMDGPLYVATRNDEDGQLTLWRSGNGGRRWQVWYTDPELQRDIASPFLALPANSFGDSIVLAVGNQVLRPRPNAWEVKAGVRRPVWDAVTLTDNAHPGWGVAIAGLAASPTYAQDRTLFAATSAGIFVSRDGAATWSAWSDGLEPAATIAVAVSPVYDQDRQVYALGLGGSVWRRQDR